MLPRRSYRCDTEGKALSSERSTRKPQDPSSLLLSPLSFSLPSPSETYFLGIPGIRESTLTSNQSTSPRVPPLSSLSILSSLLPNTETLFKGFPYYTIKACFLDAHSTTLVSNTAVFGNILLAHSFNQCICSYMHVPGTCQCHRWAMYSNTIYSSTNSKAIQKQWCTTRFKAVVEMRTCHEKLLGIRVGFIFQYAAKYYQVDQNEHETSRPGK